MPAPAPTLSLIGSHGEMVKVACWLVFCHLQPLRGPWLVSSEPGLVPCCLTSGKYTKQPTNAALTEQGLVSPSLNYLC